MKKYIKISFYILLLLIGNNNPSRASQPLVKQESGKVNILINFFEKCKGLAREEREIKKIEEEIEELKKDYQKQENQEQKNQEKGYSTSLNTGYNSMHVNTQKKEKTLELNEKKNKLDKNIANFNNRVMNVEADILVLSDFLNDQLNISHALACHHKTITCDSKNSIACKDYINNNIKKNNIKKNNIKKNNIKKNNINFSTYSDIKLFFKKIKLVEILGFNAFKIITPSLSLSVFDAATEYTVGFYEKVNAVKYFLVSLLEKNLKNPLELCKGWTIGFAKCDRFPAITHKITQSLISETSSGMPSSIRQIWNKHIFFREEDTDDITPNMVFTGEYMINSKKINYSNWDKSRKFDSIKLLGSASVGSIYLGERQGKKLVVKKAHTNDLLLNKELDSLKKIECYSSLYENIASNYKKENNMHNEYNNIEALKKLLNNVKGVKVVNRVEALDKNTMIMEYVDGITYGAFLENLKKKSIEKIERNEEHKEEKEKEKEKEEKSLFKGPLYSDKTIKDISNGIVNFVIRNIRFLFNKKGVFYDDAHIKNFMILNSGTFVVIDAGSVYKSSSKKKSLIKKALQEELDLIEAGYSDNERVINFLFKIRGVFIGEAIRNLNNKKLSDALWEDEVRRCYNNHIGVNKKKLGVKEIIDLFLINFPKEYILNPIYLRIRRGLHLNFQLVDHFNRTLIKCKKEELCILPVTLQEIKNATSRKKHHSFSGFNSQGFNHFKDKVKLQESINEKALWGRMKKIEELKSIQKIENIKKQNKFLLQNVDILNEKINNLENKKNNLERIIIEKENIINTTNSKYENSNKVLIKKEKRIEGLVQTGTRVYNENNDLKSKNKILENDLNDIKSALNCERKTVENKDIEINNLQNKLNKLNNQKDQKDQMATLRFQMNSKNGEIKSLKDNITSSDLRFKNQIKVEKDKINNFNIQVNNLTKELRIEKLKVDDLTKKLNNKGKNNKDTTSKVGYIVIGGLVGASVAFILNFVYNKYNKNKKEEDLDDYDLP